MTGACREIDAHGAPSPREAADLAADRRAPIERAGAPCLREIPDVADSADAAEDGRARIERAGAPAAERAGR
jgi:hypothetical protein